MIGGRVSGHLDEVVRCCGSLGPWRAVSLGAVSGSCSGSGTGTDGSAAGSWLPARALVAAAVSGSGGGSICSCSGPGDPARISGAALGAAAVSGSGGGSWKICSCSGLGIRRGSPARPWWPLVSCELQRDRWPRLSGHLDEVARCSGFLGPWWAVFLGDRLRRLLRIRNGYRWQRGGILVTSARPGGCCGVRIGHVTRGGLA